MAIFLESAREGRGDDVLFGEWLTKSAVTRPPHSGLDFRWFLAPLLFVHLQNLLFHDANSLVQPVRVATHPLDFNRRKPLAGVLRGLAQGFEMCGPHQE
jgi:hypothetical protein